MSLFDTIRLKKPLSCPACGAKISEIQTKEFSNSMANYTIGSYLKWSALLTGIVKETLWCSACHAAKRSGQSPVFLVIWHSVLAGVEQDAQKAHDRLAAVDRLDLIGWLEESQGESARWKRKYFQLHHDVRRWQERLARKANPEDPENNETASQQALRNLWELPAEILNAPDPLAAIIGKNAPDEAEEDNFPFG